MAKIILSITYGKDEKRKASFADFIAFADVIQWGIDTFDLKSPVTATVNGVGLVADSMKSLSELKIKDGDVIAFYDANNPVSVPTKSNDAPSNPKVVKVNKGA